MFLNRQLSFWLISLTIISTSCFAEPKQLKPFSDTGVLILFNEKNRKAEEGIRDLKTMNCTIWRKGKFERAGSMDVGELDRFVLAHCQNSILTVERHRKSLQNQFRQNDSGLLIEGSFIRKEPVFAKTEEAKDRGYLIKISRFNNLFSARESDENKIDNEAARRVENWKSEARLRVHHAIGMTTPDEVGVIYYPNKTMMSQFVKNSPDLVEAIRSFNKRHLVEASYLTLEVEK